MIDGFPILMLMPVAMIERLSVKRKAKIAPFEQKEGFLLRGCFKIRILTKTSPIDYQTNRINDLHFEKLNT